MTSPARLVPPNLKTAVLGTFPAPKSAPPQPGKPPKPTESPGDGKMWKYLDKSFKWVTATASSSVPSAPSPGSSLVADEIAAFHARRKSGTTTPNKPTTGVPGTPKTSNHATVTPPTVLAEEGAPKLATAIEKTVNESEEEPANKSKGDTTMTPSPKKKEGDDASKVSELTTSPTKGKQDTKLPLDDAALDSPDPETFFNFGGNNEDNTDNSEHNMDGLSLSTKQNKDVLAKNTDQEDKGMYIDLEYTLFHRFTHYSCLSLMYLHTFRMYLHTLVFNLHTFIVLFTHLLIRMQTRKTTSPRRGSRRIHPQ